MTTLSPGYYLIELGFTRQVDLDTLVSALGKMGFIQLTPDESAPIIGATLSSTAVRALTRAPLPSPAPKPAVQQVAQRITAPLPISKPASQAITQKTISASLPASKPAQVIAERLIQAPLPSSPAQNVRPTNTPAQAVSARTPSPAGLPVTQIAERVPVALPKPGLTLPNRPSASTPTPTSPGTSPTASPAATSYNPDFSYQPDGATAPEGEAATSSESPAAQADITELWRRWTEWGSPFAQGAPAVSGDGTFCFRFIAQLVNPLTISDKPAMKWLYVRPLTMNPFSDLDFNLQPLKLRRDGTYELRFLSRASSMPTREDVKNGLATMGFAPLKLSVMKRNMRIPGRAGASVSLWYGIAIWEKGNTVITRDDPFFFLNANEIAR